MRKAPVLEAGTDFRFKITQKIEMQKVSKPVYGFGKWLPAPLAFAALILVFSAYMIAAPVAFGMGNNALKTQAKNMAVNMHVRQSFRAGGIREVLRRVHYQRVRMCRLQMRAGLQNEYENRRERTWELKAKWQ
jgi:hypothetical protein